VRLRQRWHIRNKWLRHRALENHPTARRMIPRTSKFSKQSLERYVERYTKSYVKPVVGRGGRGIYRVSRVREGYRIKGKNLNRLVKRKSELYRHLHQKTRDRSYMIQRGVDLIKIDGKPVDFRVLLLRPGRSWRYVGTIGKMAAKASSIVTNYQSGGKSVPFTWALRRSNTATHDQAQRIHQKLKRDSMIIAKHFQQKYPFVRRLGIDYAIDTSGKPWLLEVNTSPGYELFKKHRNKKLYSQIESMLKKVRAHQ
jgi:glutathione synthase/RimK-type ligase-like ATP-grasp enzyme